MELDYDSELGLYLASQKHISLDVLEAARQVAIFAGVRIDTMFVQQNIVSLDEIGTMLASHFGCSVATEKDFDNQDNDLQARLDANLALEWGCIPLYIDSGRAQVAVYEPLPAHNFELLGKLLGYPVDQRIAGELRIAYQLERAYRIERPARFLRIAAFDNGQDIPKGANRRRLIPHVLSMSDADNSDFKGLSSTQIGQIQCKRITRSFGLVETKHPPMLPATSPSQLSDTIRKQKSRRQIGELVTKSLQQCFGHCLTLSMLWNIRDNTTISLQGFVRDCSQSVSAVAVPLSEDSVLAVSYQKRQAVSVPSEEFSVTDRSLLKHFCLKALPQYLQVFPIVTEDVVVGLYLVAFDKADRRTEIQSGMEVICQAIGFALEQIIRATRR